MLIREARRGGDDDAIWRVIEPMIREGETYPLPRDMTRDAALDHWFEPGHDVFVADENGTVVGTYYFRANTGGGGAHVCNGGYVTAVDARGRGVARAMCMHSLEHARQRGFRAMQYNLVIGSNQAAVHLWQSCGFDIVGRLPGAFLSPRYGYVDALIMYRSL